jgi:hypothetical protein
MTQPTMFSVDSANRRLPYVQSVIRDITTLAHDLEQRQERLDEIRHLHDQGVGDSPHSEEFEQMVQSVEQDFARFDELETELELVGVNVVDRSSGLVEMPSEIDEGLVWLNWQPDETEFMFWRSDEDDSMMRRPLLESVGKSHDSFGSEADIEN